MFTANALLTCGVPVRITIFERLPTPFGLVRYGVAPDHQKIKHITKLFDRTLGAEQVSFCGNVEVGRDVTIEQLREAFHAIVLAYGAPRSRKLGIPGETLGGVYGADAFVGWYNGHPDHYRNNFNLSCPTAAVVGHGNVAADICRILLAPPDALSHTDITDEALAGLRESRITDVFLIGRGRPEAAKFTVPELRALGQIPDCTAVIKADDVPAGDDREDHATIRAVFRSMAEASHRPSRRRLHFAFSQVPSRFLGDETVSGIELMSKVHGDTSYLDCSAVFTGIGFLGQPLPGVPYSQSRGVVPNKYSRVTEQSEDSNLYVAGWIKRGASGVIGTNKLDGEETAAAILKDAPRLMARKKGLVSLLLPTQVVDYEGWQAIDAVERAAGADNGKCRRKITSITEMAAVAKSHSLEFK